MKNFIFLFVLILMTGCCTDFYISPVSVVILKDNKSLKSQNIYPTFFYKNAEGVEINLHILESISDSVYSINQTSELKNISFKPAFIYIKYSGMLETDTLEILLDYVCNQKSKCSCHDIELKYLKCNGVVLNDYTIRK